MRSCRPFFAAFKSLPEDAPERAQLAPAMAELEAWDRRYAIDSVATAVAIFWGDALRAAVRDKARANRWNMLTVMAEAAPAVQLKALEEALARPNHELRHLGDALGRDQPLSALKRRYRSSL